MPEDRLCFFTFACIILCLLQFLLFRNLDTNFYIDLFFSFPIFCIRKTFSKLFHFATPRLLVTVENISFVSTENIVCIQ